MNILYIVTDLGMGGTQAWVQYAAFELVKIRHSVTVIAENNPHDRKLKIEEKGIFVCAFKSPPTLLEYIQIVKKRHVEVIHLNIWERFSNLIQLSDLCNVPVALSYHSVPSMSWKQWVARAINPSKNQWGMYDWFTLADARRFVDAHIGCCDASANGIRKKFWPFMQNKVFSLPNAIPMPDLISQDIIVGPPRFLQVGALNERKNPLLTLKAFEKIQELIPTSSLTFVGGGPLSIDLENYVQNRRIKNVLFVGEVPDSTYFYTENNILILPSKCEGLPYTLIEGAGHGMPLICSNVDGIPEVCINGYNGIILSDISINLLKEAMLKLAINPSLRSQMGMNSRKLIEQKFDIHNFTNNLITIYKTIIDRKNGV